MAIVRFTGNAQAIKQISTITVANTWAAGDKGVVTINGKSLTLTVGTDAAVADVAAALAAMINGADAIDDESRSYLGTEVPEFADITAEAAGALVVLTADTAGVPFTMTVSETTAGTGTLAIATGTAATGPSFWDNAANWDTGSVPVDADDVYIDGTDQPITDGLAQSAVELTSLTIGQNVGAQFRIGRPKQNPAGYVEYRADYLSIGPAALTIGVGEGQGSSLIKIDLTSDPCVAEIYATGSPLSDDLEAVILKGTNAGNTLEVHSGSVGIAAYGGEVATFATVRNSGGKVRLGAGCTLTTVIQSDGETDINSAVTTLTVTGGIANVHAAAAITTVNIYEAVVNWNSSGTITTLNLYGGHVFDCSGDLSARTVTTTNALGAGRINDPARTVTWTNKPAPGGVVRAIVFE